MSIALKRLWPAGLAVLAATVVALVGYSTSRSQRFTTLRLDQDGFAAKYLVFDKANRKKCFVVNRREATMRRSDERQPGTKWNCSTFRAASGDRVWFLQSKRVGEGTVFLVPAADVEDWSYPFLYEFVQRQRPSLELPKASWLQLYTDRIYQGLYLGVELPFDRRKKDGGSGVLRELLTVLGSDLSVVDSRFTETRSLYANAVADGIFPALDPPPSELAWLADRVPTAGMTFLLSNRPPGNLSLLPLPVCLAELYELKNGRSASMFSDNRYNRWTHGAWREEISRRLPFIDEELSQFRSEFDTYASRLAAGLRAQATLDGDGDRLLGLLPSRQAAVADLGLHFEVAAVPR